MSKAKWSSLLLAVVFGLVMARPSSADAVAGFDDGEDTNYTGEGGDGVTPSVNSFPGIFGDGWYSPWYTLGNGGTAHRERRGRRPAQRRWELPSIRGE